MRLTVTLDDNDLRTLLEGGTVYLTRLYAEPAKVDQIVLSRTIDFANIKALVETVIARKEVECKMLQSVLKEHRVEQDE